MEKGSYHQIPSPSRDDGEDEVFDLELELGSNTVTGKLDEPELNRRIRVVSTGVVCGLFMLALVMLASYALPDEHKLNNVPISELVQYGQNRPDEHLGKSDKYVKANTHLGTVARRVRSFQQLNQFKSTVCGGFDKYLNSSTETNWRELKRNDTMTYCKNGALKNAENCTKSANLTRSICSGQHPTRPDVTITIERLGPFVGHGGYDWSESI